MLNRIKDWFLEGAEAAPETRRDDELQLAAAALMVEAAGSDDAFDASERDRILELVSERFGLSAEESATLLDRAERRVADSVDIFGLTRVIADRFDADERVLMIEMLWEVAYADGVLHDFEASQLRRIAGLLYVSDRDSGAARKRALEKLGL